MEEVDWRPFSLLPEFSKIFVEVLYEIIMHHLNSSDIAE
jgi:hypothetical protein